MIYKIITFFLLLSNSISAQESFNIITSHLVPDNGQLTQGEVQFIYNSSINILEISDDNNDFHLPLKLLDEGYNDNQNLYSYSFEGDPISSQYGYAVPVVRIDYDRENGKIIQIIIGYFNEKKEVLVEPVIFVTDYGIEYIKIVAD